MSTFLLYFAYKGQKTRKHSQYLRGTKFHTQVDLKLTIVLFILCH